MTERNVSVIIASDDGYPYHIITMMVPRWYHMGMAAGVSVHVYRSLITVHICGHLAST